LLLRPDQELLVGELLRRLRVGAIDLTHDPHVVGMYIDAEFDLFCLNDRDVLSSALRAVCDSFDGMGCFHVHWQV
jgi:hypothetical protein